MCLLRWILFMSIGIFSLFLVKSSNSINFVFIRSQCIGYHKKHRIEYWVILMEKNFAAANTTLNDQQTNVQSGRYCQNYTYHIQIWKHDIWNQFNKKDKMSFCRLSLAMMIVCFFHLLFFKQLFKSKEKTIQILFFYYNPNSKSQHTFGALTQLESNNSNVSEFYCCLSERIMAWHDTYDSFSHFNISNNQPWREREDQFIIYFFLHSFFLVFVVFVVCARGTRRF